MMSNGALRNEREEQVMGAVRGRRTRVGSAVRDLVISRCLALWCETVSAGYVRTIKYVSSSSRSFCLEQLSPLLSVRRASPTPHVLPYS